MKPLDFFILRRPLLSTDFIFSFHKAAGSDPVVFESYLKLIFLDPLLQEALLLSSPALLDQVKLLTSGKLENGKQQLLSTLYKYLIRMSTRCTPFGLFAGYSVGTIGASTQIAFEKDDNLNLHRKLDSKISYALVTKLLRPPGVKQQLKYFPNNSLYQIMDTYRFICRSADTKSLGLSAVKSTQNLTAVIQFAREGKTIQQLNEMLHQRVGKKVAKDYIDSLIASHLLVSNFEMNATGENYLQRVETELKSMSGCQTEIEILAQNQNLLSSTKPASVIQTAVAKHLAKEGIQTESKSVIQTDLSFHTSSCQISAETVSTLASEISELNALNPETFYPDLKVFAAKLFEHFGSKPMPLLQMLDPASGIGYGRLRPAVSSALTLLTGLGSTELLEKESKEDTLLSRFQKNLLERAKIARTLSIEITLEDLKQFESGNSSELPKSCYVFGSIISSGQTAFDKGEFSFDLKTVGSPSALNLLTRFGQGDQVLRTKLENTAILEAEQNPDVIPAEICHVPDPSALNVICRPRLRAYEIPYLAHSTLPEENQILPGELLISSADGHQLELSCSRLEKKIIPVLTSAHNYSGGLPFYRFLCDLSLQYSGSSLHWDWQSLAGEPFLPRVTYKHLILQKATWRIRMKDCSEAFQNGSDLLRGWAAFSNQKNIPRYFQVQQGDHELLIDSENLFSLGLLQEYLRKSGSLILSEYLMPEGSGFLTEKANPVNNEIVIPFINNTVKPAVKSLHVSANAPAVFHLGSEWLYVKLYCSPQASDFILSKIIGPFCDALASRGALEKWFFIRYYDPQHHLRVRIKFIPSLISWTAVLAAFEKKINLHLQSGLIHRFTTGQYVRETDRYKLLPYDRIESVFYTDSTLTAKSLILLQQESNPDLRWLLALRGCEGILEACGLTTLEKLALIKTLHTEFSTEVEAGTAEMVLLDKKYRNFKKQILSFLDPNQDPKNDIEVFTQRFDLLSQRIAYEIADVDLSLRKELIETAAHLMHLFLNRWFSDAHRKQEWIIYHFLKKYYDMILNFKKIPKIR